MLILTVVRVPIAWLPLQVLERLSTYLPEEQRSRQALLKLACVVLAAHTHVYITHDACCLISSCKS
jgi:cell division protein FtsL